MLKVKQIAKDLELKILAGEKGLDIDVKAEMLSRPGVELAGFTVFFDPERLILIGSKEHEFLKLLPNELQVKRLETIFKLKPPGIIFSTNVQVEKMYLDLGEKYDVPIMKSNMRTTAISSHLYSYLHSKLAPRTSMHGVLLDIHGMGTLITGKSGIGKSETALELIKRGHILISDDRVDIFEATPGVLVGSAPKILERYIEIRGIGIVDVVHMFGAGAYRENKKIRLIVELQRWNDNAYYDRLGIEQETFKIFNTDVTKIIIPILPGRNLATLVESAAMNIKLKLLGHNAAKTLTEKVAKIAASKGVYDEELDT